MRTLVLGGVRSGKSVWAERALADAPAVTYVATAPNRPDDPEWTDRVAAHQARRPATWLTVETGDIAGLLRDHTGPFLVDDLGNWLTRTIDDCGAWSDRARLATVRTHIDDLVTAWRGTTARVIAVSNEVGSGVVPATYAGRLFRDEMGALNTRLAAESDEVVLLVAGLPQWLRSAER